MCHLLFPTPKCPPHPQRVTWHSSLQKLARTDLSKTVFFSPNCSKKNLFSFQYENHIQVIQYFGLESNFLFWAKWLTTSSARLFSVQMVFWDGSISKELLSIRSWILFPGLFNRLLLGDLNSSHLYVPVTVWKKYVGNYEWQVKVSKEQISRPVASLALAIDYSIESCMNTGTTW